MHMCREDTEQFLIHRVHLSRTLERLLRANLDMIFASSETVAGTWRWIELRSLSVVQRSTSGLDPGAAWGMCWQCCSNCACVGRKGANGDHPTYNNHFAAAKAWGCYKTVLNYATQAMTATIVNAKADYLTACLIKNMRRLFQDVLRRSRGTS